jgi:hypothetical protein
MNAAMAKMASVSGKGGDGERQRLRHVLRHLHPGRQERVDREAAAADQADQQAVAEIVKDHGGNSTTRAGANGVRWSR